MKIDVRIKTSGTAGQLQHYAEEQLLKQLGNAADLVKRATIHVEDVNGPRGGDDKRCRITLRLGRRGMVVVEERAGDWYRAVTHCAGHAGRILRRELTKRRDRRREVGPLPEAA